MPDRPGLFGDAGEDTNDDTFMDEDAAEMERRRAKLRAGLGLTTEENPERARSKTPQKVENVRTIPGFPLRSRLAD